MPQETPDYAINPPDFGLPTHQELEEFRMWDLHYHGIEIHDQIMPYLNRMGVERVFSLDIGHSVGDDLENPEMAKHHKKMLAENRDTLTGIVRIDPSQPEASVDRIERWIHNGPCVAIKYQGREFEEPLDCTHPNNDPIIKAAAEANAFVYIHTWMTVGGDPPTPWGGDFPGESTPMDVAELASRFPDVPMICGHSGGQHELAARAIRPHENVYFEYSGSPAWSGMCDYGVKWLGADRLVWGSHAESRCMATEVAKILDSDLDKKGLIKVFGENLRRIAAPIMREKGYDVTI